MYVLFAEKYGFSPQVVADMTYEQQIILLKGKSHITFSSLREYAQWMSSRGL